MTTRRAKRHESNVIVNYGHRKWLKIWDHQGFGSKWRMEASGRAPKFRRRAYNRAKEIENKSLKTEPLGLLQFVKAPFDPDPFEPFWATKEDKREH